MAGIYIHIPFCKQACHYCNFHFSTNLSLQGDLVRSVQREIEIKQDFFPNNPHIDTIYFGGGSPSILSIEEIDGIILALSNRFNISDRVEISLEANPDDLSKAKLSDLRQAGITRLSIGIQSFDDGLLKYMNRAHNSIQAKQCLEDSLAMDFDEIALDLIYGIPGLENKHWESELRFVSELSIEHLSCYALTVEPSTALDHFIRKKNWAAPDEELTAGQFRIASDILEQYGFDHYEISNFARNEKFSKHNTAYWTGEAYLGLGPSAHSYLPGKRSWNLANNARYIKAIDQGLPLSETEILNNIDRFNEYIMTGLRTKWGVDLNHIRSEFSGEREAYVLDQLKDIEPKHYNRSSDKIVLTKEGWLYSDGISSKMFKTSF